MKKSANIILIALLFLATAAQAQFRKPLQSASSRVNSSEARYNIGLVGGITSTYWLHFGGTKTQYNMPLNYGLLGGLSVERMLNANTSVSLEGFYAMRNTELNYDVLNFPVAVNENKDYYRQFNAEYQEVDAQVIMTRYLSKSNLRPYVFAGIRASVPLSGKTRWQKTEILNYGTESQEYSTTDNTIDTVEMNAQNTRQFNVGLVVGAGLMYKINVGNYYLLLKADISGHAAGINSFSSEEISGESQNVVGAGYIDPYLLGMRFNTDITAKITLMFPLKKQLQGACIRWGEYD